MKKLILVLFFFLNIAQNSFSQENPMPTSNLSIKLMPLSMFDSSPRYRIGLEYISNKKLGYTLDIGYGNYALNQWRFSGKEQDYSLFEIRPEIKYLFWRHKNNYLYAALEGFYINEKNIFETGHYQRENLDLEITFDSAKFQRQKYGAHLKLGFNLSAFERFSLDIYGGFGVARRIISYTDVVNPVVGEWPIFVEWLPQPDLFEGEQTIFHLALGFKIGYVLFGK